MALNITNELLKLDSKNEKALANKQMWEEEISEIPHGPLKNDSLDINHRPANIYQKLCRGIEMRSPEFVAKLKCRYVTKNSPFLMIAPIKMEELSSDPYLVIFHDVIYDREIEIIKYIAKPKVKCF